MKKIYAYAPAWLKVLGEDSLSDARDYDDGYEDNDDEDDDGNNIT